MQSHQDITRQVSSFIKNGHGDDDSALNTLALEVFAHQYHHNTPYRKFCDALGAKPDTTSDWPAIPAVPTDAFKAPNPALVSFPEENTRYTFLTSGTTRDIKGRHFFPTVELYDRSILTTWNTLNLPPVQQSIILTPKPRDAPQSSLAHMMGTLAPVLSGDTHWILNADGSPDILTANNILKNKQPTAILGTALSLLHWFENQADPLQLPPGSWAMETGGYKGSGRSMDKATLYSMFKHHLGLDAKNIINEYSMTELSSQFYTRGIGNPHHAPHWTRIRVIDPHTGTEAPPGEPGYLAILDLANLHSVSAIQTQDIAIAHSHRSFTLLGRDPSALPRGCSRAADALYQS